MKKGFATSAILYTMLLLFLVLMTGILNNLQNKKTILDALKKDTVSALEQDTVVDAILDQIGVINNKILELELSITELDLKKENIPTEAVVLFSSTELLSDITNYTLSDSVDNYSVIIIRVYATHIMDYVIDMRYQNLMTKGMGYFVMSNYNSAAQYYYVAGHVTGTIFRCYKFNIVGFNFERVAVYGIR